MCVCVSGGGTPDAGVPSQRRGAAAPGGLAGRTVCPPPPRAVQWGPGGGTEGAQSPSLGPMGPLALVSPLGGVSPPGEVSPLGKMSPPGAVPPPRGCPPSLLSPHSCGGGPPPPGAVLINLSSLDCRCSAAGFPPLAPIPPPAQGKGPRLDPEGGSRRALEGPHYVLGRGLGWRCLCSVPASPVMLWGGRTQGGIP